MKQLLLIFAAILTVSVPLVAAEEQLKSGEYYITQSWSQEKAFKRLYYVRVPENSDAKKLPVFIFLHGNGGNAKRAMSEKNSNFSFPP